MTEDQRKPIVGRWLAQDGAVVEDDACRLINHLTNSHFAREATRDGGWTILYRDVQTGLLWELTYPQSEMHGGGPPALVPVSFDEAAHRYDANIDNSPG